MEKNEYNNHLTGYFKDDYIANYDMYIYYKTKQLS